MSVCISCAFSLAIFPACLFCPTLTCSLSYYYVLDTYLYSNEKERKKGCRFGWVGKWGGSERGWEINCIKKSIFNLKINL